jgi:eukaryotic-like serine/threonine-protein kinase
VDQINSTLGGRYRLEALIGTGGMAKVYRAMDTQLDRIVAVKILSEQFAADDSFVERFQREARTAAKLNNPNIVGVYDSGSERDVHYIVMEYVEGRTLADFLAQGGRLSPIKAVELAEAVATGLAAAHAQGIVHRDVKPGNVMVTRDGQVKVTDFGIARLTTTAETVAQTAAVLGTASYLSPEQAQGRPVDARTDIYSLGTVLYELLTGVPPFQGDTPVAVAYKHVQETPVLPSVRNPEVAPQLDAIDMKAMAKNPQNRYQTANELREDLERARNGQAVSATPIMPGAATTQVIDRGAEPTGVLPPPDEQEGRKWWAPVLITVAVLAILGGIGYLLAQSLLSSDSGSVIKMPNVVGMTEHEATAQLEQRGLQVRVQNQFSSKSQGIVFRQDPVPQTRVSQNEQVTIYVSKGSNKVTIPEKVIGMSEAEATALLEGSPYGFDVQTTTEPSPDVPSGDVISTDPTPGTEVDKGSVVTLVVSSGSPSPTVTTVTVPDVVCLSSNAATNRLQHEHLNWDFVGSQSNSSCPHSNMIAAQDPAGNTTAQEGDTVKLWYSEEPTPPPT